MNEMNVLKRQHGLFVSICFVVGFVVGTGIFFLPGRVLYEAGGSLQLGVLAWLIGGLMILPCVYMFSVFAGKYEKIHGFVDYVETIVGEKYGYLAGWFFAVMYQPAGYAIIAWITSGFTATLFGISSANEGYSAFRFFVSAFFMAMTFMMNYFAHKLPVKYNVATTLARLIPLVLMGTVGVIWGVFNLGEFEQAYLMSVPQREASLFAAISATAFAFNGWQAALAFNSEIKDSKRNFPIALFFGFLAVIVVYVLYFVGVVTNSPDGGMTIMQGGGGNFASGTHMAFTQVFGEGAASVLVIFMIISGLGILNACCLGMSRAMYALGRRGRGPLPHRTGVLDPLTHVPNHSMVMAVGLSFLWYAVIFVNFHGWFGWFDFAFSLPDFYNFSFFAMLIPLFVAFLVREKEMGVVKRLILPLIATGGAGFMFVTYWIGSIRHGVVYSGVFVVLAGVGFLFYRGKA